MNGLRGVQNQHLNLASNVKIEASIINKEEDPQPRDNSSELKKFTNNSIKCKASSLDSEQESD